MEYMYKRHTIQLAKTFSRSLLVYIWIIKQLKAS